MGHLSTCHRLTDTVPSDDPTHTKDEVLRPYPPPTGKRPPDAAKMRLVKNTTLRRRDGILQGMNDGAQEPYEYTKLDTLPKHLCYACKKGDIDGLIEHLDIDLPFHGIWMVKRAPDNAEEVKIASASSRFHPRPNKWNDYRRLQREITIYSVPKDIASAVRAKMREDGLKLLVSWLQKCESLPELWQERDCRVILFYNVKDNTLRLKDDADF